MARANGFNKGSDTKEPPSRHGSTAVLATSVATVGTYKVTKRSIDADAAHKREEREQQRIEQAYIEIQTYLSNSNDYVLHCMDPQVLGNPDLKIPKAPSPEPNRPAAAQLHSSARVIENWTTFEQKMRRFETYILVYRGKLYGDHEG